MVTLSGGNGQVFLARWLFRDSQVLIREPTRGVDVSMRKLEIYRQLEVLRGATGPLFSLVFD